MGLLYFIKDQYPQALKKYEKALRIYREQAKENPKIFLIDLSTVLINLSILHKQAIPDKEKSIAFAKEVLEIARQLPQVPAIQKHAGTALDILEELGVEG